MCEIGMRIRQRREELNMTQEELAHKLGYKSKSSINKIELNSRNLTQSKIKAIADALLTTPSYIMGWNKSDHEIVEHKAGKEDDYYLNEDTKKYAQFIFNHPEYAVLFDASRNVKPEDIKKALKAIGIFTEDN